MSYWRNWSLYLRGFRWLWSRRMEIDETLDVPVWTFPRDNPPPAIDVTQWGIEYKPGWGPWRFLGPYLTTYLASTLLGFGCVSLSRVLYEHGARIGPIPFHLAAFPRTYRLEGRERWVYPRARWLLLAVDWFFEKVLRQRPNHCRDAGPRLWGSRSAW